MSELNFPMYKGRPLVRNGDTIYYGDMRDPYVAKIDIKTKKTEKGMEMAQKVAIQLLATDPTVPPNKMILKRAEKEGLWAAIEIADIWLERELRAAVKAE